MGVENVRLGVCNVKFGETDLGLTKGGVRFAYSSDVYEATVDQFGETPVDILLTKESVEVTVPLAEYDLTKLAAAFPFANLVTQGTGETAKKRLDFGGRAGESLIQYAGTLTLHPKNLKETDASEDVTVWKAIPRPGIEFAYNTGSERVYNVVFTGIVDSDKDPGGQLFGIGDPAATTEEEEGE